MRDNRNKRDKFRPKVQWTAEDRARHQAIREMFRNWHPSPEELIASGEGVNFDLYGESRGLRPFIEEIKRAREKADSPWPRCPGVATSTSQRFLAWKPVTTRTRPLTPSGVMPPPSAVACSWPPKPSATRGRREARRSGSEPFKKNSDLTNGQKADQLQFGLAPSSNAGCWPYYRLGYRRLAGGFGRFAFRLCCMADSMGGADVLFHAPVFEEAATTSG